MTAVLLARCARIAGCRDGGAPLPCPAESDGNRTSMSKPNGDSKNTLYCSFCGKSQHEVRKLIAGPTVFICDECVELCMDIIREENKSAVAKSRAGVPTPTEIKSVLDDYVIGQEDPKRGLPRAARQPAPRA